MTGPADTAAGPSESLVLLLDAHLMSFSADAVDQHRPTGRFPGLAQMTGLLANALGWVHSDVARLRRLQDRLSIASAVLRQGTPMRDFQTVALSRDHMVGTGWTTRGVRHDRAGQAQTALGTHIRYRWYRAWDSLLVAVTLEDADEAPTLADLDAAVEEPARPLFIGRKCCLPAMPIRVGRVAAGTLAEALALGARTLRTRSQEAGVGLDVPDQAEAEWPAGAAGFPEPKAGDLDARVVCDGRDWPHHHAVERSVRRGRIVL